MNTSLIRSTVLVIFVGIVAVLALLLFRASSPSALPPQVVLRRAIVHQALLPSVAGNGRLTYVFPTRFSGSFVGSFIVTMGGVRLTAAGTIDHVAFGTDGVRRVAGTIDVAMPQPGTLLVRPLDVRGILGEELRAAQGAGSGWLLFGSQISQDSGEMSQPLGTLSERQVDDMLDVLHIDRTEGPLALPTGDAYHLALQLASGALLTNDVHAEGDVWIDARSFALRRVVWRLKEARTASWSGSIDVTLSPHSGDLELPDAHMAVPVLQPLRTLLGF